MNELAETQWREYFKMINDKLAKRRKKKLTEGEMDFCLEWIDKTSKLEFLPSKVRIFAFHIPILALAIRNRIRK
jgi:hypothetical protein